MYRRLALVLPALLLPLAGCRRAGPPAVSEVVVAPLAALPADPADRAWRALPLHAAPLILQDLVEPRLLEPSTAVVRVQAATDGTRIAFRLEWDDATVDDLPMTGRMSDACAVQLPAAIAADVPAPQMGEPGRAVEITYWRATWQATVDGRGDTIREIYPRAAVDHYPFEAASLPEGSPEKREMALRYAPARALGNQMAGPRATPVEQLLAQGPGTLGSGPGADAAGRGARTAGGWAVVLARRLPEGLSPGGRSQVALAVWEGGRQEAGSRKMRTGWIPLLRHGEPAELGEP